MRHEIALVAATGVLGIGLLGASVAVYGWSDMPSPALAPDPIASTDVATQGQSLILAKGCGGCHIIPGLRGASGEIGPNLGGVGTRGRIAGGAVTNGGPADLQRWILDPPAAKPGTAMPKLGLTESEASAIATYLETVP